jgi:hypothetical protein
MTVLSSLGTVLLLLVSGCSKNHDRLYAIFDPILIDRDSTLAAINGKTTQNILDPRKIYVTDSYIFISDSGRGIHIFDNRNPSHPVKTAFLAIPGNQDIAVKGNTLYADMFTELLAIDISDIHQVKIMGGLQHLFYQYGYGTVGKGDKIMIGYKKTYKKISGSVPYTADPLSSATYSSSASFSSAPAGVAGSTAKMVLVGNNIYAITSSGSLQVVNVENPGGPQAGTIVNPSGGIETVYPFQDKLFVGSTDGVYIYSLTDPANPAPMGIFSHGASCDPVIANEKFAYLTLHAGNACGGNHNEMDILNVQDLSSPSRVKVVPMTSPRGLTKDGTLLFVCDPPGVKIFDASNPEAPELERTINVGNAYDVVSVNNHLVVIADKGIYQFDYSKPGLPLLSVIPLAGH